MLPDCLRRAEPHEALKSEKNYQQIIKLTERNEKVR
jgi:hypothetical protein